jgi:hypothetical protein
MAVSLEAYSILRQQLLCIILGFTICLFPFFYNTYTFLEQLWNRFHFTLLKNQLMHLFQHFHIHIKTPESLLKMFYKSVIYK